MAEPTQSVNWYINPYFFVFCYKNRAISFAFLWFVQELVEIFSQKDRKTEEFSFSSPYVRGRRLKKFCLSVYLSFSNMPVAGYLTLVNEWYFFTKKSSKNLENWEFCCIFVLVFSSSILWRNVLNDTLIVRLLCVNSAWIVRVLCVIGTILHNKN